MIKQKLDELKQFFPSFYYSSTKTISNMITSIVMPEAEYLYKADATEKEIISYLTSKMDMEVIYGLKVIIIDMQNGKDISPFIPRIFETFIMSKVYFIKRLCLCIIDHITLLKRSENLLLYNIISKYNNDPDPLNRLSLLNLIATVSTQEFGAEAFKFLSLFTADSNPLVRRVALIVIVEYLKTDEKLMPSNEIKDLLIKYLNDSNIIVYSTVFYAFSQLNISDYLSFGLQNKFDEILNDANLVNIDDFFFERAIFVFVNFLKVYLIHNYLQNIEYIKKVFNAFYHCLKTTTNFIKIISALCGLYQVIHEIAQAEKKAKEKKAETLFKKDNKRIVKISKFLIKVFLQAKNEDESIISLDLINTYINHTDENDLFFDLIRNEFYKKVTVFFIHSNETSKKFIYLKKFQVILNLVSEKNTSIIIEEIKREINYPNAEIKNNLILLLYKICNKYKARSEIVQPFIELLIDMLKIKDDNVISTVVNSLSDLIEEIKEQKKYVLIYSIKGYKKNITNPVAKSNIIAMLAKNVTVIPTVIVDFFRRILLEVDSECPEVKLKLLTLTLAIHQHKEKILLEYKKEDQQRLQNVIDIMISFSVNKSLNDSDLLVKEKARITKILLEEKLNVTDEDYVKGEELNEVKPASQSITNHFLEVIVNSSMDKEKKFVYDILDENTKVNMEKISFDKLIDLSKSAETEKKSEKESITDKYSSCKEEKSNVSGSISNISSSIDIEKKKQQLKNQLDDFLNDDDEDENDEFEVEIKKG